MNYKHKFFVAIIIPIIFNVVFFAIIAALLVHYDHLQLKTQDYYDENKFTALPNMRLQAKGIIKHVQFDSVILGTSMLANSSAMEASRLLGGSFVNLSLLGARTYERGLILNDILRNKQLKNVIYSLDAYHKPKETSSQLDNWELLYDNYFINDLWILLDAKYIIGALKNILIPHISYDFDIIDHIDISRNPKKASIEFFDCPIEWLSKEMNFLRFGGLENWAKNIHILDNARYLLLTLPDIVHDVNTLDKYSYADINISKETLYIEKHFLRFVREHPETKFYVVFPPYYRLKYAEYLQTDGEVYYIHQKIIRYMVQYAEKHKNLHIYGFEDLAYLDDTKNYIDSVHYNVDMNKYITKSMADNKHRITTQNVDAYLEKCEQLAQAFDIQKFYHESQRLLRQHEKPTTWQEFLSTTSKIIP